MKKIIFVVAVCLFAVSLTQAADVMTFGEKAENLRREGKYKAAIEQFDRAIENNPNDSWLYFERGFAYSDMLDKINSMKDNRWITAKENYSPADEYLAGPKAEKDFSEAIRLEQEGIYYSSRGDIYYKLGKYAEAVSDYEKYLALTKERDNSARKEDRIKRGICKLNKFKRLLELNKPINKATIQAVESGDLKLLRLLVEQGADLNLVNENWAPLIFLTASDRQLDVLSYLLSKGVSPNTVTDENIRERESCLPSPDKSKPFSVLTGASLGNQIGAVKTLIDAGADLNFSPLRSPLAEIALMGEPKHFEVFKYLLDRGANPNIKNAYDSTPLILLFDTWEKLDNDSDIAKFAQELIKHGADVNLKNIAGETALARAVKKNYIKTQSVLLAAGAKFEK